MLHVLVILVTIIYYIERSRRKSIIANIIIIWPKHINLIEYSCSIRVG